MRYIVYVPVVSRAGKSVTPRNTLRKQNWNDESSESQKSELLILISSSKYSYRLNRWLRGILIQNLRGNIFRYMTSKVKSSRNIWNIEVTTDFTKNWFSKRDQQKEKEPWSISVRFETAGPERRKKKRYRNREPIAKGADCIAGITSR